MCVHGCRVHLTPTDLLTDSSNRGVIPTGKVRLVFTERIRFFPARFTFHSAQGQFCPLRTLASSERTMLFSRIPPFGMLSESSGITGLLTWHRGDWPDCKPTAQPDGSFYLLKQSPARGSGRGFTPNCYHSWNFVSSLVGATFG